MKLKGMYREDIFLWDRERSMIAWDESILMDLTQNKPSDEEYGSAREYALVSPYAAMAQ